MNMPIEMQDSEVGTFTVFCRSADNMGTTWIGTVKASSIEEAAGAGREQCAKDWLYDEENVVAIGVAAGDVQILYWEDME